MSLRDGRTYDGVIQKATWIASRAKGTTGLQVDVETPEGDYISHVWWVTEKTKERFAKDMADFGIEEDKLRSGTFLKYELLSMLVGHDVTFTTKAETYNGNTSIKVGFLNAKKGPSDPRGIEYAVASLFGGTEEAPADHTGSNLTDDDIPF